MAHQIHPIFQYGLFRAAGAFVQANFSQSARGLALKLGLLSNLCAQT